MNLLKVTKCFFFASAPIIAWKYRK